MVKSNARRINPAGQRVALDKLRQARRCCRSVICAILHGKCIQNWLQRSGGLLSHERVGNVLNRRRLGLGQTQALVRSKKEGLLFSVVQTANYNWAADGAPKIVLPECRWRHPVVIIKPVVGIKVPVSQIVESAA